MPASRNTMAVLSRSDSSFSQSEVTSLPRHTDSFEPNKCTDFVQQLWEMGPIITSKCSINSLNLFMTLRCHRYQKIGRVFDCHMHTPSSNVTISWSGLVRRRHHYGAIRKRYHSLLLHFYLNSLTANVINSITRGRTWLSLADSAVLN